MNKKGGFAGPATIVIILFIVVMAIFLLTDVFSGAKDTLDIPTSFPCEVREGLCVRADACETEAVISATLCEDQEVEGQTVSIVCCERDPQ